MTLERSSQLLSTNLGKQKWQGFCSISEKESDPMIKTVKCQNESSEQIEGFSGVDEKLLWICGLNTSAFNKKNYELLIEN